jgi:XTP/dITP diphosphohydrolase
MRLLKKIMPNKILIATTNSGKAREISAILKDIPIKCINLGDPSLGVLPEAPEDAETFEENAKGKALHYGNLTMLPTVAEDAGLQIPALDGWPGVYSARVAETDAERVALALNKLHGKVGDEREARFMSIAAFYDPSNGKMETFPGICQGFILDEPRGENGFGYDPIFWHPGYGKSLAELTTEEKNAVSHRGQSFRALAKWLGEYYQKR